MSHGIKAKLWLVLKMLPLKLHPLQDLPLNYHMFSAGVMSFTSLCFLCIVMEGLITDLSVFECSLQKARPRLSMCSKDSPRTFLEESCWACNVHTQSWFAVCWTNGDKKEMMNLKLKLRSAPALPPFVTQQRDGRSSGGYSTVELSSPRRASRPTNSPPRCVNYLWCCSAVRLGAPWTVKWSIHSKNFIRAANRETTILPSTRLYVCIVQQMLNLSPKRVSTMYYVQALNVLWVYGCYVPSVFIECMVF